MKRKKYESEWYREKEKERTENMASMVKMFALVVYFARVFRRAPNVFSFFSYARERRVLGFDVHVCLCE